MVPTDKPEMPRPAAFGTDFTQAKAVRLDGKKQIVLVLSNKEARAVMAALGEQPARDPGVATWSTLLNVLERGLDS